MTRTLNPLILAAFAAIYLVWGSTYLAVKFAIATFPPFTMMGVRCLFAGGILYGWARWRGAEPPTGAQWAFGSLVGAALFVVGGGGVVWAQQRVPSGTAALFLSTVPLWMTLIQTAGPDGGRLTGRTWGGVTVGSLGILVLAGPSTVLSGEPVDPVRAVILILSAISWAIGSELSRRGPRSTSFLMANGSWLLAGGAVLLVGGAAVGEGAALRAGTVSAASLVALGYLIVFGSVVTVVAYTWLLQKTSLTAVSTYAFVNPLIAVFLGWTLGDEALDSRVLFATVLVVTAVVLILSDRRRAVSMSEKLDHQVIRPLRFPKRGGCHDAQKGALARAPVPLRSTQLPFPQCPGAFTGDAGAARGARPGPCGIDADETAG